MYCNISAFITMYTYVLPLITIYATIILRERAEYEVIGNQRIA